MKQKKLIIAIIFLSSFIWAWQCKNPNGPGIDWLARNWYMSETQAPGYRGPITYGDRKAIDPKTQMGNDKRLYTNNRNINYRIPALLTLKNGNILAFADKRYNGAGDLPNRIEVMVKISTNNGTNWTDEKRVTPISTSTMDGNGDTGCVLDRKTGDVLALVAAGQGFLKSTSNDPIRIKVVRSKDGGESWLAPVDITSQVYGAGCKDLTRRNWQAAFVTSGNGLQMRNGRIIFVLNVRQTTSAFVENYILYSDDGGYKWRVSRGSPKNPRGGNEAKVVELNDGSLLMHIRWTPNRLQSRSYDYGETWTEATVIGSLPASSSNGDLIVYTSTKNGYDKDRLITLVDSRAWNGKPSGYPGVPVFYVSYDEGYTWSNKKQLYNGNAGYSSLAILKDGSIGILAELGNSWNGPIYFLKTSIEWCNPNDNPCSPTNSSASAKKK